MDAERWQKTRELVAAAENLGAAEWKVFLARECAGDDGLLQEVEALLHADLGAVDFLEEPALGSFSTLLEPAPSKPQISDYTLGRELGRGGMGEVYEAHRDDEQVRRRVAVKVLQLGLGGVEFQLRFRREIQILADLDEHTHIAKLIDFGHAEDGRAYFLMEYVEGLPIDRYCREQKLDIRARIELFLKVCGAVHYAHRNQVVHRDLKPTNILVTADGEPKLIDFGVAKPLRSESDGPVTSLGRGAQPMTPEYASPEQIRGEPITTATDVYSLGALLYELLTGRRPYDFESRSPIDIEKVIAASDVVPPSERARREAISPADLALGACKINLSSALKGDLDTIVLKALHRKPDERYSGVNKLADDLKRHLNLEPILARPATWSYVVRRFIVRDRRTAAGIAAFVLMVIGFGVALIYENRQTERQKVRAEKALGTAEREARHAREVADFLVGLFEVSDPNEARGRSITADELLEKGSERIGHTLAEQPLVRARLLVTMGRVYRQLGIYPQAKTLLEEALALLRGHSSAPPLELAHALAAAGDVEQSMAQNEAARALYLQALQLRRESLGPDHLDLAPIHNELGNSYRKLGELDLAEEQLKRALQLRERELGSTHEDVTYSLNDLGLLYHVSGRLEEAGDLYRRALDTRRRVLPPNHPHLAVTLTNLGGLAWSQGNFPQATSFFQQAIEIWRKTLGSEHDKLATAIDNLGHAHFRLGRLHDAEQAFLEALDIRKKALGPDHPDVANSLQSLGHVAGSRGALRQAADRYKAALEIWRVRLEEENPWIAFGLANLGVAEFKCGNFRLAVELLEESLAIRRAAYGDAHPGVAHSLMNLGVVLRSTGQLHRVEDLFEEALAIRSKALGPDHQDLAVTLLELAVLCRWREEWPRSESLLDQARTIQQARLAEDDPGAVRTLEETARVHLSQGRLEPAQELFQQALARLDRRVVERPEDRPSLLRRASVHIGYGWLWRLKGEKNSATDHWRQAVADLEAVPGTDFDAERLSSQATALWLLGEERKARALTDELVARGWYEPLLLRLADS